MADSKRWAPPEQRFWDRVNKTETCWLWTGHTRKGYGRLMVGSEKNKAVHQYSWEIHNGSIPEGLDVLHKCDIKCCVNPEHLYLGTDIENSRDRVERGLTNFGKIKTDPCPHGHEFNDTNFSVYWNPNAKHGPQFKRTCLVCARERMRK